MDEKMTHISTMRFCLEDHRANRYNASTDCSFKFYGNKDDEAMSIEDYYCLCKQFAAAMGFTEKTIEEWFGRY